MQCHGNSETVIISLVLKGGSLLEENRHLKFEDGIRRVGHIHGPEREAQKEGWNKKREP